MDIKQKLKIHVNVKHAHIDTKLNGKELDITTRNTQVGGGVYELGIEFKENIDNYVIETWTIENSKHYILTKAANSSKVQ